MGRDLFWWLSHMGLMKASVDTRLGRKMAKRDVLIGSSTRGLRRAGVTLKERLENVEGRRAGFTTGGGLGRRRGRWATGYRPDLSWLDVGPSIVERAASIAHRRGVTWRNGPTFLGLPWQYTRGSALLGFVKDDAAFIAGRIDSGLEKPFWTGREGLRANLEEELGDGDGRGSGVRDAHRW